MGGTGGKTRTEEKRARTREVHAVFLALRNSCFHLPFPGATKNTPATSLQVFHAERRPRRRQAARDIPTDTFFFLRLSPPRARALQLTLTADSVRNNSVKLSIKFMVLEIQSTDRRRVKIQLADAAIFVGCPRTATSRATRAGRLELLSANAGLQ